MKSHTPPPSPDPSSPRDDSYLWDRSGPPDPIVERLESLLAPLRLPASSELRDQQAMAHASRRRFPRPWLGALAAVLAVCVGIGVWYGSRIRSPGGWEVSSVQGAPKADGSALRAGRVLPVGAWLETDDVSTAQVRVASIGTLDVAAGSRLRIMETTDAKQSLELAHGRIHARIAAPPRVFFVQTRAAVATDMGCRYELDMPKLGAGTLDVLHGWVMLEGVGSRATVPWVARVPQGVRCRIDPARGPGTPFKVDSAIGPLVTAYDERGWETVTVDELRALLDACGSRDAITVWHLMYRVGSGVRPAVYDRLRVMLQGSAGVDASAAGQLDPDTMERLWAEVLWMM